MSLWFNRFFSLLVRATKSSSFPLRKHCCLMQLHKEQLAKSTEDTTNDTIDANSIRNIWMAFKKPAAVPDQWQDLGRVETVAVPELGNAQATFANTGPGPGQSRQHMARARRSAHPVALPARLRCSDDSGQSPHMSGWHRHSSLNHREICTVLPVISLFSSH